MSIKVIFLDVDGVLNCRASKSRCGPYLGIDNDKVKRLRRIVEATGAKIVLTSTWRMGWQRVHKDDQDALANYLDRKLKRENLYILDRTYDQGMNRGEGIMKWIEAHNVDSFIMLDDERFDYARCGIISRLVKSTFDDDNGGIQDEHVELAIALLSTKQND